MARRNLASVLTAFLNMMVSLKLNNKGTKVVRELDTGTIVGVQHIKVALHLLLGRFDLRAGGRASAMKNRSMASCSCGVSAIGMLF